MTVEEMFVYRVDYHNGRHPHELIAAGTLQEAVTYITKPYALESVTLVGPIKNIEVK